MAFYGPVVQPLVHSLASSGRLEFDLVDRLREKYSASASTMSTMKALVRYWPGPATALSARICGRKGSPHVDRALRVAVLGYNNLAAKAGLTFIPNMRAPLRSPIEIAHRLGISVSQTESLRQWTTSDGSKLQPLDVYTSARRIGECVYALVSI